MILSVLILLAVLSLWIFGPREPADLKTSFDEKSLGSNLDFYLETVEAKLPDIVPGTEKRIIWHRAPHQKTPVSIVYLHGFSASSEEIRPVPDEVAKSMKANLYFARLTGHGRSAEAMGEATAAAWMHDIAEALAIARRLGDRVILISTSTGGTLSAAAACDPLLAKDIAEIVFISPNFGVNNPAARLLTWPFARSWVPPLFGIERKFESVSAAHEKYWTNGYPLVATLPMAALVKKVVRQDFGTVDIPALFIMSDNDQVVRPDMIDKIANRWGGRKHMYKVNPGPNDDKEAHVIAGDIFSPDLTEDVVKEILDWLSELHTSKE